MVDTSALPGSLDLFELMVNYVAGSVWLSGFIWAGILLITGIMGRLSIESIMVILITFIAAFTIGYLGALITGLILLFALYYAVSGLINYINTMR